MSDEEFFRSFESGALPPSSFHHRDHVRLAWLCLRESEPLEAIGRFSRGLKDFALRAGKPGLYHETVTWAYLLLIHQRMQSTAAKTFEEFERENGDLMVSSPSVLGRYYKDATLISDLARRVFVMPDRLEETPGDGPRLEPAGD